jgi:chemotaxis protein MotB
VARRKNHEEHENHERWLVSYADFITLLFAFFVVLYATSTQNEEKEKKFEDSVRAQFKMAGGEGKKSSDEGGLLGQVIDPIDVFQQRNVGNGELEDYVDRLLQKNMSAEERKLAIGGLRHDSVGVRISLAASTFFPVGQAKLRLPALRSLDKIADILKKSKNRIIIEGHTDDQALVNGGAIESNWELASLRATSVVRYLIKYHGISPKRLAAISYADQKPLVPNTTDENRAKNRRIEILIVNGEDSPGRY